MTPESFEELLSYIGPQIQKTNTKYRKYARGAAHKMAKKCDFARGAARHPAKLIMHKYNLLDSFAFVFVG